SSVARRGQNETVRDVAPQPRRRLVERLREGDRLAQQRTRRHVDEGIVVARWGSLRRSGDLPDLVPAPGALDPAFGPFRDGLDDRPGRPSEIVAIAGGMDEGGEGERDVEGRVALGRRAGARRDLLAV